jgi:hypothetical protein
MAKIITIKEMKGIIKAFSGTDVTLVKEHITNGIDPNNVLTIKWGNIYDENNPYTLYDIALRTQAWYLHFISETKKFKEQGGNLDIIKYITPLITSAYPITENGTSYTCRALPPSIANYEGVKIGMYDELLLAMLENGYKIEEDKGIFKVIGLFSLDVAKAIIQKTGADDGDSVYSAAHDKNIDVLNYLLSQNIPVNKPFTYSTGNINTALHEIISLGDLSLAEKLLIAGADIDVKNVYDKNCIEWAEHHNLNDMVDLLNKYKN